MSYIIKEIDKSVIYYQKYLNEQSCKLSVSQYDLFCYMILYHDMKLSEGFVSLLKKNNHLSAYPIFIEHIDLCLQLYASKLISYDLNLFAKKMINKYKLNYMKDKYGNSMNKKYLINNLAEYSGLFWLKDTYKSGANPIYFSYDNIDEIDGVKKMNASYIPDSLKIELSIKFNQISNLISQLLK